MAKAQGRDILKKPGSTWMQRVLLVAVLGGALWLRTAHLAQPSFHTDEYLHVLSAQQLIEEGKARLPSGNRYERAKPYTWTVAGSFALFGVSETTARLPSVLFGTLVVLLTYLVGRRWFGVWPALLAAALVTASPIMVATSRLCRMYSLFQLLYLGIVFAYERSWEQPKRRLRYRALWLVVGGLLLLASAQIHPLTLVGLVPSIGVYWAGRAVLGWRSRYSVYLLIAAFLGLIGIASGAINVDQAWQRLSYAPSWAEGDRHHETLYMKQWAEAYPWIWWVAPVAVPFLLVRHRALGFLVSCFFLVPFGLHSLLAWKHPRYVSYLFPLLALVVSPLLVWGIRKLGGWVLGAGARWRLTLPRWRRYLVATGGGIAVALLVIGACVQPLTQALALREEASRPRWREAYRFLARTTRPGEAIVASIPLAANYYLDRPATHVLNNYLLDFKKKMKRNAHGLWVDLYSGLPLVTSLAEFRKVRARYARGWVVVDRGRFRSPRSTPQKLNRYLVACCQEHQVVGNGSVRIFRWDETSKEPSRVALGEAGPR